MSTVSLKNNIKNNKFMEKIFKKVRCKEQGPILTKPIEYRNDAQKQKINK